MEEAEMVVLAMATEVMAKVPTVTAGAGGAGGEGAGSPARWAVAGGGDGWQRRTCSGEWSLRRSLWCCLARFFVNSMQSRPFF